MQDEAKTKAQLFNELDPKSIHEAGHPAGNGIGGQTGA